MAVTIRTLSGAMAAPDERFHDIEPARTRRRAANALCRLWAAAIALPDRGDTAKSDEVPPEFFRFPHF
jgi:hypothetical protein